MANSSVSPPAVGASGADSPVSLNHGMEFTAMPGPTVVPERVRNAMARPMADIYDGEIPDLAATLFPRLAQVVATEGHPFLVIGNGHSAWQMVLCNTISRGEKVLVLESGLFAVVWGEQAAVSGIEVEVLSASPGMPADPAALERRLMADDGHEIAAVLTVQSDTASSVRNDIPGLRAAMDAAGHPALLMVDCIASLGCEPYEMDAWGVDVTVGAAQKGLMVPPGIAFAWAGPKAVAAYERGTDLRVGYFDWGPRMKPEAPYQLFSGTAPIPHLFALDEALNMIDAEGLQNRWHRHRVQAEAVWAAVEAWATGDPDGIGLVVDDPAHRSWAVTTVRTGSAVDAGEVSRRVKAQAGVVLGFGVGGFDDCFRIGHMGYLNPPMLLGVLGSIEAVLLSLGVSAASSGVAAATTHISQNLA